MKKKFLIFNILFIIFALIFLCGKTYASTDLDEIEEYIVTVDPRMTDGTLDIVYEISWKVLDSDSEGPLSFVTIGTPNSNFDTATAITSNIASISKYNSSYVKIVFTQNYYAGEVVTFKYSIHQSYMYELDGSKVTYSFTPAWFTDIKIKEMTIRWNQDSVVSSDNSLTVDSYLTWTATDMSKGAKMTASVEYEETSFTALDANKTASDVKTSSSHSSSSSVDWGFWLFFAIVIFFIIISSFTGGGYYGHRGFYVGGHFGGGGRRRLRT